MKNQLFFIFVLLITLSSFGQVTWTGQGVDPNWNTQENWSSNMVPGPVDDVVIPDGFTVILNLPGGDVQSLDLQGTSSITMVGSPLEVANTFTIDTGASLEWFGNITGGGAITNDGVINIGNSNGTLSSLSGAVSLTNNGTINLNGTGDIFIATGCTLTNSTSGSINITGVSSGISRSGSVPHIFNNSGILTIDTPLQTDQTNINVQIQNNNGTIQVETGILNLNSDNLGSVLTDGIYNIFSGARLNLLDTTELAGTLSGTNNGTLNLPGILTVPIAATLNIGGSGIILFDPSINGTGTLTNQSVLTMQGFPTNIQDGTTLVNQNLIDFTAAGDIFICNGSTLNNDVTGIIDFKGDTGNIQACNNPPHTFLNSGLIRTSFTGDGSDTAQISAELDNTGTIEVNNGTLTLFNSSIQLNGGTYNIGSDGVFEWSNIVTISGSMNGTINGNGVLKWNGKVNVPVAASFDFGGTGIIDWFNGNLDGGGILTNNNILNIGSASNAFIFGGSTLVNNNTINFNSNDDLLIETGGTLNNEINGDINFLADGAQIGVNGVAPRLLNNNGDIFVNLPNPDDDVTILCEFNNNDANIQIEQGVLNLNNNTKDAHNLIDGTYNIFADGVFDLDGNVTLSGELAGTVSGPINWRSVLWVNTPSTATLFFTGDPQINWVSGSLNGGGTLINSNTINHTSFGNLRINGGTTLDNKGNFKFTTFGDLQLETNSVFNNLVDGTIEFQQPGANMSTSGAAPHTLNNVGTLIADTGGVNSVSINTSNSGLIDIRSGELEFNESFTLTNETTGIIKGSGTLDIPALANFTNNGTTAPGASPGTLTVIGDYTSTSTAILDIEIDGLVQGTDFDFIPITGDDVVYNGIVNVTLGFDADISDEFVISTTTGTIANCNIQTPTFASFGGFNYEFDVICRNDFELVLTVLSETLSLDEVSISNNDIILFPNPASENVYLKNNSNIELNDLKIYDLSGRLVVRLNIDSNNDETVIPITNIPSGLYIIKVNSLSGTLTKRLIVK